MNNNNRGNNNRRRGRGNNNGNRQGGGQQTNRIDSRARGNAPQMLEKYRKLAHDAHLNGDRVQSEYYLQFADHYFRVIADTRLRQEEQRARREDRWEGGEAPADADGDDFSVESDFPTFDQPVYVRREREDRPERQERAERPERGERQDHGERAERGERQPRREKAPEAANEEGEARDANPYEPAENPFIRPNRNSTRGLRPRREERQPRAAEGESLGLDPSSLPPAIAREEEVVAAEEEAPKPKPRRRTRKVADEGGEGTESAASVG